MASNVVSDNFETGSGGVPQLGGTDRQNQWCKAWVNFDGDPVSIKDSYNVSSITDNSAGDFTITFASAMADANFSASASVGDPNFNMYCPLIFFLNSGYTSSSVRVNILQVNNGDTHYDARVITIQVFGN